MATRMQQRRGTAAQWTSANPILAVAEIGYESDTGKFKIGDGTNHWADLTYFTDAASIAAIIDGAPDLLNTLNELAAALGDDPDFINTVNDQFFTIGGQISGINNDISQLANLTVVEGIDDALSAHVLATTSVHGIDDTSVLVTTTMQQTAITNLNNDLSTDISNVQDSVNNLEIAVNDSIDNLTQGLSDHEALQTSVHGITNTQNLVYTDDSRLADERTPVDGTVTSAKIVNDAVITAKIEDGAVTANKLAADSVTNAKIANDAVDTAEIKDGAVTNDKLAGSIAQSKVTNLTSDIASKQDKVSGVSDIEISYLDGVTSAIQTQLDDKAPIASPTFTGTVSGVTKTMVGLGNVDNTSDANKPISSATQTALDDKAPLASPTFTGTVSGITKSMVGLGNVDNTSDANKPVSTATQTALDAKLSLSGGTMTGALTLSGAPTVDLHAATKAYVDNVVAGINFHQPVRVATTGNITLSGTQTIDGVSLSVGDRVLVKDQTDQKENGIYVVASSTWSRATDADNTPSGELAGGDFCLVLEGTANSGYGYVCSNTSAITIGSSNITYAAYNAAKAVTAGSGLTESTPGTLDIATGGVTSAMIADGTIVNADINASAAIAATKIAGTAVTQADTGTVTSTMIADGTIVNGDISASAAIAYSKLNLASSITSSDIVDGTIVDADINASAAIAQSKISGLTSALSAKAPTAAPTFTGLVTVSSSGVAFTDGTQTGEGVISRTPIVQKTASYTLSALTERDSLIEIASASGVTLTVPANSAVAFPVGTSIDILQTSTGQITVAGAAGVTVNATPGLKLRTQWSGATLFKRATDTWVLYGDLSA